MSNPNHASKIETGNMRVEGTLTAGNLITKNEWKSYTPTVLSGGTFATSATIVARYRILGNTLFVNFSYTDTATTGAASTGSYKISLPSGVTFASARQSAAIGTAVAITATPKTYLGTVLASTSSSTPGFTVVFGNETSTPATWGNASPAADMSLNAAGGLFASADLAVEIEPTSTILTSLAK